MFGKIIGTGSYIPKRIISNQDLMKYVDTNDQWVQERTGIKKRPVMEQETTAEMAIEAGKQALLKSKLDPKEVDMIIVSTVSPNQSLPCIACQVQNALGTHNATCFDVNAACTGFLVAYNTVQSFISTGMIKNALIIGAEGLSRLVDWEDRGTCILFADGAGAAVVAANEGARFETVMHSDGSLGGALTCENAFAQRTRVIDQGTEYEEIPEKSTYIGMDGQAVFRFAIKKVPESIKELMAKLAIEEGEIDCFLLHQANKRIIESIAKRLRISMEKVPMNVMDFGNTSSASIPILLDELVTKGDLKEGDRIIMAGFGAGLTWAATYLEL